MPLATTENMCRTVNGFDINGYGQLKDGRGNICPVTIILPTIAMEARKYCEANGGIRWEKQFMTMLEETIEEAKDTLLERFEYICCQPPESARFMYENGTIAGYNPKEGIRSALKHGTLAIGLLGMAETIEILMRTNQTTELGMKFAQRICQLFKDKCAEYKEKYKLNFGVYYTPAEMLCHTAMTKFKQKYGEIPRVSENSYFTNSIHIPVWEEMDMMKKIKLESMLTGYSSAGCITYVEFDASVHNNIDALDQIVNYAMDLDIPYFAINVPNDMCLNCGYTAPVIKNDCPKCNSIKIQRLRRVTGYLTADYKTAFNKGKQDETDMRVKHGGKEVKL